MKKEKFILNTEQLNLFLFTVAKMISIMGSSIYMFAISLYVLRLTGSGLFFATNIILYTIPLVLVGPLAGVIVDKIDKKRIIVASDLLNSLFLLGVFVLFLKIKSGLVIIYLSTLIITILSTFANIGIEAAKPNLVSEDSLIKINSIAKMIESSSNLVGPILGGMIYAFIDLKVFILVNAISFLSAAIFEWFIDYQYNISSSGEEKNNSLKEELKENLWIQIKEGYGYIVSNQSINSLLYIFIALNFFISYAITVPLPYLLNSIWQISAVYYGIIQSAFPAGILIGSVLVKGIIERISYNKLLYWINWIMGLEVIFFTFPLFKGGQSPNNLFILVFYTSGMLFFGFLVALVDVPIMVILQRIVPGKILGRVISLLISLVKIVVPVTLFITGILLNIISIEIIFISGGIFIILFNVFFFSSSLGKSLENMEY